MGIGQSLLELDRRAGFKNEQGGLRSALRIVAAAATLSLCLVALFVGMVLAHSHEGLATYGAIFFGVTFVGQAAIVIRVRRQAAATPEQAGAT
jgi:hypothetical protein